MVVSIYKLFLTGFAVLVEQGTMGQLVVGSVISCITLTITALVRPSKHWQDDVLEMICQGAVVANLALAILLKSSRQTTATKLQQFSNLKMDDDYETAAAAQDGHEDTLGLALMAIGAIPIAIAIVLALAQLGFVGRLRQGRPSARLSSAMISLSESSKRLGWRMRKKIGESAAQLRGSSTAPSRTPVTDVLTTAAAPASLAGAYTTATEAAEGNAEEKAAAAAPPAEALPPPADRAGQHDSPEADRNSMSV